MTRPSRDLPPILVFTCGKRPFWLLLVAVEQTERGGKQRPGGVLQIRLLIVYNKPCCAWLFCFVCISPTADGPQRARFTSPISILPVVTQDLAISSRFSPCDFLSRCEFSTFTTRQPMVEFLLTHVLMLSAAEARIQIMELSHDFQTNGRRTWLTTYYTINRPLGR